MSPEQKQESPVSINLERAVLEDFYTSTSAATQRLCERIRLEQRGYVYPFELPVGGVIGLNKPLRFLSAAREGLILTYLTMDKVRENPHRRLLEKTLTSNQVDGLLESLGIDSAEPGTSLESPRSYILAMWQALVTLRRLTEKRRVTFEGLLSAAGKEVEDQLPLYVPESTQRAGSHWEFGTDPESIWNKILEIEQATVEGIESLRINPRRLLEASHFYTAYLISFNQHFSNIL